MRRATCLAHCSGRPLRFHAPGSPVRASGDIFDMEIETSLGVVHEHAVM